MPWLAPVMAATLDCRRLDMTVVPSSWSYSQIR